MRGDNYLNYNNAWYKTSKAVVDDYKHILSPHKVQMVVEKEGIEDKTGKKYNELDLLTDEQRKSFLKGDILF
jgi:hypothetical protein